MYCSICTLLMTKRLSFPYLSHHVPWYMYIQEDSGLGIAFNFWSLWNYLCTNSLLKKKVTVDKIIVLGHKIIKPRIQTLLEDKNIDVLNLLSGINVFIILNLFFAIWISSSRILTVSKLIPLVNFWMVHP